MIFDLSATFAAGGAHDALRRFVLDWLGVENLPPTATTVELLDVLRHQEVLSQIPQPQDRLLPNSEVERINGAVVIAEENQVLWCATLDRRIDQPTVAFFEEPPDGRRPGSQLNQLVSVDLDRFLLGVLVENATYAAGSSRFRTRIGPGTEIDKVVAAAEQLVVGIVQFPAVIAGPGWFGVRQHGRVEIVAVDPELRVSTVVSEATWERFTEIPPSQTRETRHRENRPSQLNPTVPHWRWMPVAK